MVLERPGIPLQPRDVAMPVPGEGQVLIHISACAVCRTDLHVVDGELKNPKLPLIPGHEIVGRILAVGDGVRRLRKGDRVGVPWLGSTCGRCNYCGSGRENLCDEARFTGYNLDGGYAEYTVADARYAFVLDGDTPDAHAAPLLCAGLIGYRALRIAGDAQRLGLMGFGAAAHIIAQVANHQGRKIYAFTRPGDDAARRLALQTGAVWAGDSNQSPPHELDAIIIFAPVGALVPRALELVCKGGVVVCAGIHMSDIPAFPYTILWGERCVRSVANLARIDGDEFLALAPQIPVRTEIETFALADANMALDRLRAGQITGAAVLVMDNA